MKMTYPPKSGRCSQYREMLFEKGFAEAKQKAGHFFHHATEQTAFVINLEDDEESCITILYGFDRYGHSNFLFGWLDCAVAIRCSL